MENNSDYPTMFDLFFGAGAALKSLFQIGFYPQKEDLHEMTCEQYKSFFQQYGHTDEKIFVFLPSDSQKLNAITDDSNATIIFTESNLHSLEQAWQIVEEYCAKAEHVTFQTDKQKLQYAASLLPDVFTIGTPYEGFAKSNLRIVRKNA